MFRQRSEDDAPRRRQRRGRLSQLVYLLLLGLTLSAFQGSFVRADDDDDLDVPAPAKKARDPRDSMTEEEAAALPKDSDNQNINEFTREELNNSKTPMISITNIEPEQGPITGDTRVLVRGGPFSKWEMQYKRPKCKFGEVVVDATYVTCMKEKTQFDQKEGRHKDRTYRCLQCDNSPPVLAPTQVSVKISVTGDFSDNIDEALFTYYPKTSIYAFYPRYGPKDGDTPVQVWGDNFRNFGNETRCGFGTKTTQAKVFNSTYIECHSPQSDVVEKPIPFTISLNGQQNSRDTLFFYYYNWPSIEELQPNHGPEMGGTHVMLKGRNFFPFKEILDEIDNANDTFCAFLDLKVRVPAIVTNSTRAMCISPPSYYWHQSRVEITLNGVEYTDDEKIFYYYKPPLLFDVQPREGPVRGGTKVTVSGTNFQNTEQIRCSFGEGRFVPGKFISTTEVECVSPEVPKPGFVDLRLAFEEDMWSTPVKYLYYDIPKISHIEPTCGPETGYTQIEVHGSGFTDLGRNKAMCVFNRTVFTNATVMTDELMFCDSPALLNVQGYSLLNGDDTMYYHLQVTIDGGHMIAGSPQKFNYYQQVIVKDVTPNRGPLRGSTEIAVNATGLKQPGICGLKMRLGTYEYTPEINALGQLVIQNQKVDYPGYLAVQISYNNQQFSGERVVHKKDPRSTFKYYQNPIVTYHSPITGPSAGGTAIKIDGYGFKPFDDSIDKKTGTHANRLFIRYLDSLTNEVIAQPKRVDQDKYTNFRIDVVSEPQPVGTKALFQISLNKEDWINVKAPGAGHSFTYYESPHITSISPSFGPLKSKANKKMILTGTNFVCQDPPCKDVKVRFGTPPNNAIYEPAELLDDGTVRCNIPMYTKPDVLPVQVTLNGFDYSNDNATFGFYDPYVISAEPRLIATDGSTKVTVKGLGFVNSGETKVQFHTYPAILKCGENNDCIKPAGFIDKNHLSSDTLPQNKLNYADGKPISWDPLYIEASVYNNDFTENRVPLYYYEEPVYEHYSGETPSNIQTEILIGAKIQQRDMKHIRQFASAKARFWTAEQTIIVDAILMYSPLISAYDGSDAIDPNTIKIKTPMWQLKPGQNMQAVKLDIAINGYNFVGNFDFTFTEPLILHRTVPMAGPLSMSSNTFLIGQGFRAISPKTNYNVKWGVITTDIMPRAEVENYSWDLAKFENTIDGCDALRAYIYEASRFARVDTKMYNETEYRSIYRHSTKLIDPKGQKITPFGSDIPYKTAVNGGPWYVEVGRDIRLPTINTLGIKGNVTLTTDHVFYDYDPSAVEFYQYPQPTMLSKHPHYGVDIGGTAVEIIGYSFLYKAEYGIVPHCKFGDKIVRAEFDSTVRLVCYSPPNDNISSALSFEVSLNGVDWSTTGQTFSYYKEPIMQQVVPDAAPATGGTEIFLVGQNFPNMVGGSEFNCRFTPTNSKMAPKMMAAQWLNSTTIMCTSPGGWSEGDRMKLQVTFNGRDYDKNGFMLVLYKIDKSFPRSGPSDGFGGDIMVSGQGFRPEVNPLCRLNGTIYEPVAIKWNEIRCPMPPAAQGPDFFGNVDFAIAANGVDWKYFDGGFQYYKNPIVEDIFPKTGPAQGIGIINFYGSGFRSDFPLANLGCKVGNSEGQAILMSDTQIRCVIEDMETVAEGEKLTAQAALNSYSWSTPNDDDGDTGDTFYVPYSVSQIYPQSGPATGGTDVIINGRGFIEGENPRCRFGTPANYVIVEADILSYTRMACRTPEGMVAHKPAQWPADVPFAIALNQDSFEPWTQTSHKFRFYKQPTVTRVTPDKVTVGSMQEILVEIDDDPENPDNVFFEPMPVRMQARSEDEEDEEGTYLATMGSVNQLKCSFGRFGDSDAVFVDERTIKCITPSVPDDPNEIYAEEVSFSVSMNGLTFAEEDSDEAIPFTFEGSAEPMGLLPVVLMIIALGILIAAIIFFVKQKTDANMMRDH